MFASIVHFKFPKRDFGFVLLTTKLEIGFQGTNSPKKTWEKKKWKNNNINKSFLYKLLDYLFIIFKIK